MGPFTPPTFTGPARLVRALLLSAVVLAASAVSLDRALRMRFDFHHFYLDGRYTWEYAALNPNLGDPAFASNRQLGFYLPTVSVLIAPLTAFGPRVAAVLWTLMQAVSLGVCLAVLARMRHASRGAGEEESPAFGTLLLIIALPAIYEAARFNQLSFLVLALSLLGVEAIVRRRDVAAGAWLAAAATIKLLPALFLFWLVLKHRGRAAAAMLMTGAAFTLIPPLVVFGPQRCAEYHFEWWRTNVAGILAAGVETAGNQPHFADHRNQSLRAVAQRVSEALGGSQTIGAAAAGLAAIAVLVLFAWRMRRSSHEMEDQLRTDAALVLVVMLILSPLVRTYYLVWALPALASLIGSRGAWPWIGWAAWIAGIALWPFDGARYYGVHLIMLCVLAAALSVQQTCKSNCASA